MAKRIKQEIIFIALLLGLPVRCSNATFLPEDRASTIAQCLKRGAHSNYGEVNNIFNIIGDYDTDPSLEARSKKYYACVQAPYQRHGMVVLCNRSGVKLQSFPASYVHAIALSPQDDIIIAVHEKTEGSLWGIPYQSLTGNFFWRSLALTVFSIETGATHTFWPSSYYLNIPSPCIKKTGRAQYETLSVVLRDQTLLPNGNPRPAMHNGTFTLTVPCSLKKIRRRLQDKRT